MIIQNETNNKSYSFKIKTKSNIIVVSVKKSLSKYLCQNILVNVLNDKKKKNMLNIERERRTNRWERAGLALAAINLILSIGVIILTISFLKMDSVLDAIGIALVIAVITCKFGIYHHIFRVFTQTFH